MAGKSKLMHSRIVLLGIAVGFSLSVALCVSLRLSAQVSDKKLLSESKTHVSRLVRAYWDFSQSAKLVDAANLTTKSRKGFTFSSEDPVPTWEEIIYSTKLKLVEIKQISKVDDSEMEVACKVRDPSGKEFYLFHTVVNNGKDWKIFATTY